MNTKPDIQTIITEYCTLSSTHTGSADLLSQNRVILEALKPAILRDYERGVTLQNICKSVRQSVPAIESDALIRSTITNWLGRKKRSKKSESFIKKSVALEGK